MESQLVTPGGEPYGLPAQFQVQTTAYTRVASWVVVAAAVLSILVVVGITRRIREQRRLEAHQHAAGTDDDE